MIVSVVGAYDREAIQSFLNPLISTGGNVSYYCKLQISKLHEFVASIVNG